MHYLLSGDYHLGHSRIIEYSNRPFKSAEEMNETIIRNHNERVKPEDIFIHNGDFCYKHKVELDAEAGGRPTKAEQWLSRLNGHKIMIKGNHDASGGLKTIIDSLNLNFAGKRIHVVHKPEHSNASYEINLIAHIHNRWTIRYFKEHYKIIEDIVLANKDLPSDRVDLREFLERNYENRNSDSVLLNVGIDAWKYRPVLLDECIGKIAKFRKGLK